MNPKRRTGLDACRRLLEREGFEIVDAVGDSSGTEPDLVAEGVGRRIFVIVLVGDEVDSDTTRDRIRRALGQSETRVYAPRILRWRVLSNLERWGLAGAPVLTY